MTQIKETCLHARHCTQGAQMSPFAGYDMPIVYTDITAEHNAVRNAVGVFDVSHMGEVAVTGANAERFVNYIFSNDIAGAPVGKVFYGMMLNERGGVVDDLLVYKRSDTDFFLVINAANIDKDVAWIESQAAKFDGDVKVDNQSEHWCQLAVQGPDAERTMLEVLGIDGSDLTFYTFRPTTIDGQDAILSRTGYTGEDGFEIYAPADVIIAMWDRLMAAGVVPCGLGCRDTLRFEAGLPLYGDELTDDITPLEAGLGMFAKLDKTEFIGRDALAAQKAAGLTRRSVGLEINGRMPVRHGYEVLDSNDNVVGEITTGYLSPTLDRSIAMALVDAACAALDTPLKVRVRRRTVDAKVIKRRFYTPNYRK